MADSVDSIISDFFAQLTPVERFQGLVERAEVGGITSLSRFLRAYITSEVHRAQLVKHGIRGEHAEDTVFYVCPHCGLIYASELLEQIR